MNNKTIVIYILIFLIILFLIYKLCVIDKQLFSLSSKSSYSISKYIGSRSFTYICDHHVDNPYSESTELPTTFPTKNGESIYIHTTALSNFVKNYLPKIKHSFVLLTGDTDKTIPDDYINETNTILEHPLLLHWYAQNSKIVKNKLTQLPIGLDFHTLNSNQSFWWGPQQSVEDQEKDIDIILSKNTSKINKCYSNFHFGLGGKYTYDREDAINKIPKELIFYEPDRITRIV